MTSERVPLAGVVGWPIAHSKSPQIHQYWLSKYKISGYYVPIGVESKDFKETLRSLPKLGFVGVNITIPYKEQALNMASSVTDRARSIGAANTITFLPDGTIHADNTDGLGFINNIKLQELNWDSSAGPALVLGAGGAARAVISSLLSEGTPRIILANRTKSRAEMLQKHFGTRVEVRNWNDVTELLSEAVTIINTTSMGMVGQQNLDLNFNKAQSTALVTDIVYTPLKTRFLENAEKLGLKTVDGLGMLLHQAVPGFHKWFGTMPEVDKHLREIVLSNS